MKRSMKPFPPIPFPPPQEVQDDGPANLQLGTYIVVTDNLIKRVDDRQNLSWMEALKVGDSLKKSYVIALVMHSHTIVDTTEAVKVTATPKSTCGKVNTGKVKIL